MRNSNRQKIHIINPLWNAEAGSERRTLALYHQLQEYSSVSLWSGFDPDPRLMAQYHINRLVPSRFHFPVSGTHIYIGVYYRLGLWPYFTNPGRIILIYNTPSPHFFRKRLMRLSIGGLRKVEVVYTSELLRNSVNYPGVVEPSPIDINQFLVPAHRFHTSDLRSNRDKFTIGRLSRDSLSKHHSNDPVLYQKLVNNGCQVKIMGGTCLADKLSSVQAVTLLPAGDQESPVFLQDIDCFFYRTSEEWTEPFGRVVAEAMACGLPVVCENRGGYTELIKHGVNGFLFDTDGQALNILLRLKEDPSLCKAIGEAARSSMESLYSPGRRLEMINFYLGL